MTRDGYAIASTAIDRSDDGPTRSRVRLTDRLGCTETTVDAYRPRTGEPARLPAPPESVCVPLDDAGELVGEETWPVPRRGIARVAAGSELSVRSDGGTTQSMRTGDVARVAPSVPRGVVNEDPDDRLWLMIGAPPTGDPDGWVPGAEILEWPETG